MTTTTKLISRKEKLLRVAARAAAMLHDALETAESCERAPRCEQSTRNHWNSIYNARYDRWERIKRALAGVGLTTNDIALYRALKGNEVK